MWAYFVLPETKSVPLEELAAIFGDDDEIVVYMKDIHIDHNTHQLVVDRQKGSAELGRIATELHGGCKTAVEEVEGTRAEHLSEKNASNATESV